MRPVPIIALLALVVPLTLAGGCIVVAEHCDHCDVPEVDSNCTPPAPGQPGNYAGAIRAACTLHYSSEKSSTLSTIAAKPDIDEPSQFMLINALRGSWGYSSDKTHVLETLVSNPALTPRASLHVANNLAGIVPYSSDRKKIADLLVNKPLPPVPAPTAEALPK
ncbi:MAG: hypothetical protein QM783_11890 [Phycisphaerales bacterium]